MAESGTVTLLFTDLVSSTQLLGRAGDEAGQRIFHAHHKLMSDAINGSGGEELQWLGDGVLAAFSSSADAVRCAIRIQQTARRPIEGARVEIRIGLHVGEVLRGENGYFGSPVVIARRLCDRAVAGQILCSKLIADLLSARQSFTFRDLGSLELKGITTPTAVSEVVYEHNDVTALLHRTPFVGRSEQLKRLSAKLEEACNGHGSIAMLQGEPGIGKTRTIAEFSDLAVQRGALVLHGSCYDGEWQPPYGPFAEAIANYARHAAPAELAAALGNYAATLARIVPGLRERVGGVSEPAPLDKDEERFRLLDAVSQFLIALSRKAPLVLVLDDLHWADRGTVGLLNHVAHIVNANPMLLIGAYRDAEVDRMHPLARALATVRRLPNFEILPLKGLQSGDVVELLGIIADQDAPDTLVQTLSKETEGNPLFIREVLLHLVEEGKILRDGKGWGSKFSISELGIPEGVRSVIGRRLMKLSENANRLLTVGACFKGSFSFEVAAAVAELDEDAALSAIDEALDAQLLRPGVAAETFDFTHALIRHSLYSGLNSARRIRLHRRMAEAMERTWGEKASEHAAEVAYQFWCGAEASGANRGADYAIAAANNAETAYAHDEAVAFLRIALELLARDDPRRPRLLARLGLSFAWTLNPEEAVKISREAGELIAAAEGNDAAADYLEEATRAMYSAGLVRGAWELAKEGLRFIGDRRDTIWASLTEIDLLREEAEDSSNPGIRADSVRQRERRVILKRLPAEQLQKHGLDPPYNSRAEVLEYPAASAFALLFFACDYRRSLPKWQQEAADAERKGRIAWAMSAWAGVARCHIGVGDLTAGLAAYDRAKTWQARADAPSLELLNVLQARQDLRMTLDENWEELMAPDSGPRLMALNPSIETHWSHSVISVTVASVLARLNMPDRAMQWLAVVPRALEIGASWAAPFNIISADATFALWFLNRSDYCAIIERAIREKILLPDFRFPMRDSRLSIARLCALQQRYDEASEWFGKARVVLDEQGARPLRAITDYDEALMYLRRGAAGDIACARPFLDLALEQFRKIGMTGWIRRAEEAARTGAAI
jgi:class 3 adenylate cyclase